MIGSFGQLWLSADVSGATNGFWDGVEISSLGAGGTALLLAMFVVAILRGWLVPRRILLDKEKQLVDERAEHQAELDRMIDDRNQWRSVAHLKDEAHRELARSVDQMTDAMRSINAAFVAFPEGVRRVRAATGGEQNA